MTISIFQAQPVELPFDPCTTALIMIDMQRDFVEAGGFGEALGNDVSLVRTAMAPCQEVLAGARQNGIMVIHTREGHRQDLSDCPSANLPGGGT
ncbi:cysteine hydrolase family protein, partial [Escherichia coli]|uniref:cysteine hydrolase family protein n=1 Tax=Escherichia coli TaxID=562 RepID=UPI00301BB04A